MRLIDADEVIKFYANFIDEHGFDLKDARFSIRDIEMNLWNIPTVEPTVNKWIPCSERLPKERERVLICLDAPINQICVSQRVDTNYWIGQGRVNVLAWQPLPKPYEVEE